jgi:hypothetical protein
MKAEKRVPMKWTTLLIAGALVSACNCGPKPIRDGGVEDAGFDGGGEELDSGTPG